MGVGRVRVPALTLMRPVLARLRCDDTRTLARAPQGVSFVDMIDLWVAPAVLDQIIDR